MSARFGKKRNFTLPEKNLLLQILKNYKHIIDNKNTDNISAARKKSAWKEIAEQYNKSALVMESASGDQLRRLWFNIKTRQKEAMNKKRQERLATEGKSPCPETDTNTEDADIVPALLVEVSNGTDSDSQSLTIVTNSQFNTESTTYNCTQKSTCQTELTSAQTQTTPTAYTKSSKHTVNSTNVEKIRIQILKQEHQNNERRADERHAIEMDILKEQLKLAQYKTEMAYRELNK